MNMPADCGDLEFYAGDSFNLIINFPSSVSGSTWEAHVRGGQQLAVDTTQAATGVIVLRLTGVQTEALPPLARWDLAETGQWNDTILRGRLVKVDDVNG